MLAVSTGFGIYNVNIKTEWVIVKTAGAATGTVVQSQLPDPVVL